ncbi:MAG: YicC family protein [Deltaproteobacteria bacterium]|nr:YicC family protein [Deltaproteobacteria bacterium]
MLNSMTGYGRGEASSSSVTIVVELKSVNNRFRDLQLRSPREYMPLEPRINNMLKDPFTRGRIDAYVRRSPLHAATRVATDVLLAREYVRACNDLAEATVGFVQKEIPFTFVLAQPGVLTVTEAVVDVLVEWEVLEAALLAAVEDLLSMRRAEGEATARDLVVQLGELRQQVADVEASSEGINERLRQRLEARVRRMIGDRFDPLRIAQEVALLVDKADVTEEISRLRSHCDQFDEAIAASEPVGRRLDFLLQEMNREVNTIGSKAAEHPISQRVVDMKTTLERMREQAANVE